MHLENHRLRARRLCQRLNVLCNPNSATTPITLSEEAHKILRHLAKRDNITLSAVIVKRLQDTYEEALLADQE
jgi:hypothetical protein